MKKKFNSLFALFILSHACALFAFANDTSLSQFSIDESVGSDVKILPIDKIKVQFKPRKLDRIGKYTELLPGTEGSGGTDARYVTFGVWPQKVLSKKTNVRINKSVLNEDVDAKYYLGNDGYWYAENPENAYGVGYRYSDGSPVRKLFAKTSRFFCVEPIKWRVLSRNYPLGNGAGTGTLLLAENILACSSFSGKDNLYDSSDARKWLSDVFLNAAFTKKQREKLRPVHICSTPINENSFSADKSGDFAFLLSLKDVYDSMLGFDAAGAGEFEESRIRCPTDYALSCSSYMCDANRTGGVWWLRASEGEKKSSLVHCVLGNGKADFSLFMSANGCGIVPAICVEN